MLQPDVYWIREIDDFRLAVDSLAALRLLLRKRLALVPLSGLFVSTG